MPGTLGMGACGGPEGAKLITRLQLGLGHAIRTLVFLQISKQLHGHLTYLRPGGAFLMGVASLQEGHFTTCCSLFPEMSIIPLKKRITKLGINIKIVFFINMHKTWWCKTTLRWLFSMRNFLSSPSENYYAERNVLEHLYIKVDQIKSGDFQIEGKFVTSDS